MIKQEQEQNALLFTLTLPAVGSAAQERPLRHHKEPQGKRPIGMLKMQLLHAQLTPEDFKFYCDSSFSDNKRAEPAAQRQAIMTARFNLKHMATHEDVCTSLVRLPGRARTHSRC